MNMAQAVVRYHLKVRRCPIKTLNRVLSKDGHPAEKIGDRTIFTFRDGSAVLVGEFECSEVKEHNLEYKSSEDLLWEEEEEMWYRMLSLVPEDV